MVTTIMTGRCNHCGLWADALDRHRLCLPCHIAHDDALEELRETAAMYCHQLPAEVAEALHGIPYIEKQHPSHS